tara:strand:+ start:602 stop:1027 length:426 start_codon:yes stop_codon:yes gene_type:complete
MVGNRETYLAALDSLYAAITGLDVSGYRLHASDKWTRARRIVAADGGTDHLEAWIGLGGITAIHRDKMVHEAVASFLFRYRPDDDGHSQASLQAAQADMVLLLTSWSGPRGARSIPTTCVVRPSSGEFLMVDVFFDFWNPR